MNEDNPESFFTSSRKTSAFQGQRSKPSISKRAVLITTGIIILIALVIFAVMASSGNDSIENPTANEEVTPTVQPTPTIEESVTPTESLTPSPSPEDEKDEEELDRGDLTIEIQNGSGVAGAATKMSNLLEDLGYEVVSTGNADSFDYTETEISVKSTKRAFLSLLEGDLEDDYTIGDTSTNLTGSDADAVIIIGAE